MVPDQLTEGAGGQGVFVGRLLEGARAHQEQAGRRLLLYPNGQGGQIQECAGQNMPRAQARLQGAGPVGRGHDDGPAGHALRREFPRGIAQVKIHTPALGGADAQPVAFPRQQRGLRQPALRGQRLGNLFDRNDLRRALCSAASMEVVARRTSNTTQTVFDRSRFFSASNSAGVNSTSKVACIPSILPKSRRLATRDFGGDLTGQSCVDREG